MPSRVQFQMTEAEERKRRQEKFRKRTGSLFNKAKLLAKDTDAWVALIVRDRSGQINSFRSSGDGYWPPSIKDLIKKHPSGTHEFLKKHVVSGCWKEATEEESDSALVDGDANSLVEDIRARKATSVENEARPYNSITVDVRHVDNKVEVAQTQKEKPVERVEPPNWLAVNPRVESDSRTVNLAEESDCTTVDGPGESGNASVDALGKPSNTTSDSDLGSHGTIVEPEEPDHMNIDAVGESNNTTLDVSVESDSAMFQLLRESDNGTDVHEEAMAVGVHIAEMDLASEYDLMDLDIPGTKSRVGMNAGGCESIEAASALCTMSQHSPRSSGGFGSWQMVNWPKKQHDQQDQGPKLAPPGIGPKELLQGWDWVFQRGQR